MLKFTKIHGIGNDYIYINLNKYNMKSIEETVVKLCDRHFGVGSDGVIFVYKSDIADFKMRIFNPDGSEAEMCGNGIRGLGKYVYENKLTRKNYISVETKAGIKYLNLNITKKVVNTVCVNMGKPIVYDDIELKVGKNEYKFINISMGNPHAVIFVDDLEKINIDKVGKSISENKIFENRTNVEFVKVIDNDNIEIRVYERGVGETLACGTGACASVVASVINGYTGRDVDVKLLGGSLNINLDPISNNVFMSGPAVIAYEGIIYDI